ncbi:MAG: hypothetical protein A3F74_00930 [Betaproteobacteria bacterium RIFCSPLOWO2_12_FULL_62_58]|nr:MAG: hypothetical protein A3F74_00930 [Betaproteobacteria bacterium RIFCSPLOWO2_12_FULL_62_58]
MVAGCTTTSAFRQSNILARMARLTRVAAPKDQGLLECPSAPLLLVNGKKDDQQPIEDLYLLLEYGNPKEARVYPEGGHMGRSPGTTDEEIIGLIVRWLKSKLAA